MSLILNPYSASTLTISLVTTVENTGNSIDVTGLVAQYDLLIFTQFATSDIVTVGTPSGFTSIAHEENTAGLASGMRFSYKIAAGTETTITPTSTGSEIASYCYIFRPSRAITTVTANTWSSVITNVSPNTQTVDPSGLTAPVIIFGRAGTADTETFTFSTASPAFDATDTIDNGSAYSVLGYKIYNTSPQTHTIDIGDPGLRNMLMSGAISVS
jgi:hypothetical protein